MEEPINFKRLYELSIIEKEQIMNDNQKHLEKINELTKELNEYKIENYGIYCGKYNTNVDTAQALCTNDNNCSWNKIININGKYVNSCTNKVPKGYQN